MIDKIVLNMARSAVLDNIEALDKKTLQRELRKTLEEKFILQDRVSKARELIKKEQEHYQRRDVYINANDVLEILDKVEENSK